MTNFEPAHGGGRCLRCGFEFEDGLAKNTPISFCTICVPAGTARQDLQTEIGMRESTISIDSCPEEKTGQRGDGSAKDASDQASNTIFVTPKWQEDLDLKVGQTMNAGPLRVRFKVKLGPAEGKWFTRITVDLNNWSSTRSQFEDRLIWADAARDEYLEILTVAASAEIVWTSGWTSLREHREGGPRPKSYSIPDFSLPLMKRRQAAYFGSGY